ncbi:polysaccharide pyruvyl transferase family protein [Sphingobium fluviale]|uniref:Polysaccharide pyruvyl transferase family protein n=2 Tax=Sphingobium fluviale TaxID=2506423 RepID=A0A4Q1KKQ5_9SPHN|nr:polysaccharide pyruvyl transferase family protein [Sphingobium fluviale]
MSVMDKTLPNRASAARPHIRIGLLWHSASSGNLGVGALTVGNLTLAREVAASMGLQPRFVILSMRDGDAPLDLGDDVEIFRIDTRAMLSPSGFWATLGRLDCVLDIGAGDSFADIYGPKRFAFLWLSKMLSIARRVPLVLSPQTIGPFTKPVYRALGAAAIRGSAVTFARDEQSLAVTREMAPRARAELAVDVAFVLPFEDRSSARGGAKIRVGVNASGLLFHQAETGTNRFGLSYDYAAFTRALLGALCAREDVAVHLVTHATSNGDPTDDDSRLADRLAQEFPAAIRVPNFATPSDAKSFISSLDCLVAARMHACIGALSAGTPVVPVAYSRKFSGLFGLLGYNHVLPMRGVTEESAVGYVLGRLDHRPELAEAEVEANRKVKDLLDVYRAALKQIFAQAVARA